MYIMSFYEKYLKYKAKYLELKAMMGGSTDEVNKYTNLPQNEFMDTRFLKTNSMLLREFEEKLKNSSSQYTMEQFRTYLHALNGYYHVFHGCKNIGGFEHITKTQCLAKQKPVKDLYNKIIERLAPLNFIRGGVTGAKNFIAANAINYDNYLKTHT